MLLYGAGASKPQLEVTVGENHFALAAEILQLALIILHLVLIAGEANRHLGIDSAVFLANITVCVYVTHDALFKSRQQN